jgi:hypothetical protein
MDSVLGLFPDAHLLPDESLADFQALVLETDSSVGVRLAPLIPFLNRSCRFRRSADSAVARQGEVDKGTGDLEME